MATFRTQRRAKKGLRSQPKRKALQRSMGFESLEDRRLLALVPSGLSPGDMYYLAFVSSRDTLPDFGGKPAADTFVDSLVGTTASPVTTGASYQAIVSDNSTSAGSIGIAPNVPIYNTNGQLVATTYANLFAGAATTLLSPIAFDEAGQSRSAEVWTGTNNNGTVAATAGNWSNSGNAQVGVSSHTNSQWIDIGVGGNISLALYAISEKLTAPPAAPGSVHGIKFEDLNANRVRDPGEPGLPGWTINLVDSPSSGAIYSAVTMDDDPETLQDETGMYWIEDVPPGVYFLSEVQQAGWIQTTPDPGDLLFVTVGPGQTVTGRDFGNYRGGSIHGQKWDDLDGDGVHDPNEIGLNGWVIQVTDPNTGAVIASQTTHEMDLNGDGHINPVTEAGLYWITGLPPGTYHVGEVTQSTAHQTFPSPQTVLSGRAIGDNYFRAYVGDGAASVAAIGPTVQGPGPTTSPLAATLTGRNILTGTTAGPLTTTTTDRDFLYVAAWSDDTSAQGFLADLDIGGRTVRTGDPLWRVFPTAQDIDTSTSPTPAAVGTAVGIADSGSLWIPPAIGPKDQFGLKNGSGSLIIPPIAAIDDQANWVWHDTGRQNSTTAPFVAGFNHDEYLLFRYPTGAGKHVVTVSSGQVVEGANFGNNRDTSSIHGFKFLDVDGDGMYNADVDRPMPHVKFSLYGDSDGDGVKELTLTHTNEDGEFWFTDLMYGEYTVSEATEGYLPTTPTSVDVFLDLDIEVVAFDGQAMLRPDQVEIVDTRLMFGNQPPSSIHGFKYEDVDRNGSYDPQVDRPWAGVWIALWGDSDGDGDNELLSGETNEQGEFWFTGLHPGTYEVSEIAPEGSRPTTPSSVSVAVGIGQELVAFPGQAMLLPGQTEVVVGSELMFGNARNTGSIHGQKRVSLTRTWHNPLGTGGIADNFATGNTETTNPSSALNTLLSNIGATAAGYDSTQIDRHFIETFTGLPTGILSAQVRIGLRSLGGQSSNDSIVLSVLGNTGVPVNAAAQHVIPISSLGAGPVHTLSVPAAMLPFLNGGKLDVRVQDDTAVDFVELCIHHASVTPRNGWTIDLVDAMGKVIATQTTMSMDVDGDGIIDPATETGLYWFDDVPAGVYTVRERPGNTFVWTIASPTSGQYPVSLHADEKIEGLNFVNRPKFDFWDPCWIDNAPLPPFAVVAGDFEAGFLNPGNASAQVITFDGINGPVAPDTFLASHGVRLQSSNPISVYAEGDPATLENLDGYDGSYRPNGDPVAVILNNRPEGLSILFDEPVASVGGFVGSGKEGERSTLTIRAFASDGSLLAEQTVEVQPFGDPNNREGFFGIRGDENLISRIQIVNDSSIQFADALIWDDLYFDRIPGDLEGDFDQNGAVDALDLALWENGLGTAYDGHNFLSWQRSLGSQPPASTAQIDAATASTGIAASTAGRSRPVPRSGLNTLEASSSAPLSSLGRVGRAIPKVRNELLSDPHW